MALTVHWGDVSGMKRMENALGRLNSHEKQLVLQRAVNHTGDKARTQVIRVLSKQTGLNYGVIKRAVKTIRAYGASASSFVEGRGSLTYTMWSSGGDISLKYFKARETRGGVTAAPFGKRQLFAGSFMKGGHFPNRVNVRKLNGHVYEPASPGRTGKSTWGRKVNFKDSGVIIPAEMIKGASLEAFQSVVNATLPDRVSNEIRHLVPGFFD